MSHKHASSKAPRSAQSSQTKRKNSLSTISNLLDFQLTQQQALYIQSRLPKMIKLINVLTSQQDKHKQENKQISNKNNENNLVKIQYTNMHDEKKNQRRPEGKIKNKPVLAHRRKQEQDVGEFNQLLLRKQQKSKKQAVHKKKISMKPVNDCKIQNDGYDQFIVSMSQKQFQKDSKILLNKDPQIQTQNKSTLFARNQQHSYIQCLPNNEPRYTPIPLDHTLSLQIPSEQNTLRYFFGLPYDPNPVQIQAPINKLSQTQKNFCINILQKLKLHQSSQPFRIAVDPQAQGVPDYYYVVYQPMDLHTIYKKVVKDKYTQISQFHGDINRIILNSYKYNLRDTVYFQATVTFQDYYQQLLKNAAKNPQEYAKQYIQKCTRKRITQDPSELDFTQKTPMKKKNNSGLGDSLKLSGVFAGAGKNKDHKEGQKKYKYKKNINAQDVNASYVASQAYNQFLIDNTQNNTEVMQDAIFKQKQKKQRQNLYHKLQLHRANSMPLDRQQAQIFSQSLEFHNTQSNNSNVMGHAGRRIKDNSQLMHHKKMKQIIKSRIKNTSTKSKISKNAQDNDNYEPEQQELLQQKQTTLLQQSKLKKQQQNAYKQQGTQKHQKIKQKATKSLKSLKGIRKERVHNKNTNNSLKTKTKHKSKHNVFTDDYNDDDDYQQDQQQKQEQNEDSQWKQNSNQYKQRIKQELIDLQNHGHGYSDKNQQKQKIKLQEKQKIYNQLKLQHRKKPVQNQIYQQIKTQRQAKQEQQHKLMIIKSASNNPSLNLNLNLRSSSNNHENFNILPIDDHHNLAYHEQNINKSNNISEDIDKLMEGSIFQKTINNNATLQPILTNLPCINDNNNNNQMLDQIKKQNQNNSQENKIINQQQQVKDNGIFGLKQTKEKLVKYSKKQEHGHYDKKSHLSMQNVNDDKNQQYFPHVRKSRNYTNKTSTNNTAYSMLANRKSRKTISQQQYQPTTPLNSYQLQPQLQQPSLPQMHINPFQSPYTSTPNNAQMHAYTNNPNYPNHLPQQYQQQIQYHHNYMHNQSQSMPFTTTKIAGQSNSYSLGTHNYGNNYYGSSGISNGEEDGNNVNSSIMNNNSNNKMIFSNNWANVTNYTPAQYPNNNNTANNPPYFFHQDKQKSIIVSNLNTQPRDMSYNQQPPSQLIAHHLPPPPYNQYHHQIYTQQEQQQQELKKQYEEARQAKINEAIATNQADGTAATDVVPSSQQYYQMGSSVNSLGNYKKGKGFKGNFGFGRESGVGKVAVPEKNKKNKYKDQDYKESQDDEYVINQSRYPRIKKNKVKNKNKTNTNKDTSSNKDISQQVTIKKRRGRHSKKYLEQLSQLSQQQNTQKQQSNIQQQKNNNNAGQNMSGGEQYQYLQPLGSSQNKSNSNKYKQQDKMKIFLDEPLSQNINQMEDVIDFGNFN